MKWLHSCLVHAIPTALLMQNKCLCYWMDNLSVNLRGSRSQQYWARDPELGVIAQSS
ncbi:MAG TPA: hypothetical protein VK211_02315 [Kamptonema sp.]|nr:hypothetical protein [Kamptonema sp.]